MSTRESYLNAINLAQRIQEDPSIVGSTTKKSLGLGEGLSSIRQARAEIVDDDSTLNLLMKNAKSMNVFKEAAEEFKDSMEVPVEDISDMNVGENAYKTAFLLMDDLQENYGMTTEQAAGFVGNIWHETGGFKFMQELDPMVEGSRGGGGFAMFTGPRRQQFDKLREELGGLSEGSYEANWAMIAEELDTTEKSALRKILKSNSVEDAAEATSNFYLRPGIPALSARRKYSRMLYKDYIENKRGK